MDIGSLFGALRAAANSMQEIQKKMVITAPTRSTLLDSYDTLIEKYCSANGLRLYKEQVPTAQETLMYYIDTDDFRTDIQIAKDFVEEVWVHHPLKMQPEGCPKMAKALRLKDMMEFHEHMKGLQNMYSLTPERHLRRPLFLCLTNLENDLMSMDQHISQWQMPPLDMVKYSPCGLLVPRSEGKPLRVGFFVAPSDLVERDGSLMRADFVVLGARQIGLWASVTVTAISNAEWLPSTPTFRRVFRSEEGFISCDFAPLEECNPLELSGSFVLTLKEPIIVTDRVSEELEVLTGFPVRTDDTSSQPYLQVLHNQFFTGKSLPHSDAPYKFVIAGQHHAYSLHAPNELTRFVTEVCFAHVSVLPSILNGLRRQATINKLFSGCMRNVAENEIISPFAFDVTYSSPRSLMVEFSHPLDSSPVKVQIGLAENGSPSWAMQQSSPALCTDAAANTWLRKTLSIPVVLRTIIKRFAESYVDEPTKSHTRTAAARPIQQIQKPPLADIQIPPSLIVQHVETLPPIQKTAPSITALLESKSTPPPLLLSANQGRGTKMEKMLMDKKPASRDKTVSPKSMTMDKSEHTKKLKALYETNGKKQSLKTKRKAESFDLDLKPKKRKSMADIASSSHAGSSKSSDSSSSLENELTKPVASPMGRIRIAKSELSPHGSPITIKLIKRESTDSGMQAVIVNKEPPKKKKTKPAGPPEPKKLKKGLLAETPPPPPEVPKKIKREPGVDTPDTPLLVSELKKPKKEVLSDFSFLPEPKPSKFKPELGVLETHLLQSKKGSPNKSPTERKSAPPTPVSNTKVTLIPTKLTAPAAASSPSKSKEGPVRSAHFQPASSRSPVPLSNSPSKSPVPGMASSSAPIFQPPKPPSSIRDLPRIPKKNANAAATPKAASFAVQSLASPLGTHATPAQVAAVYGQLIDKIFAESPTKEALSPAPNVVPFQPPTTQSSLGTIQIQTFPQGLQSGALQENIDKVIAASTAERQPRPNPGLVIDIPPHSDLGDTNKSGTRGSTSSETIASPLVKSRNPTKSLNVLAIVDRLAKQSKSRVDSGPDNSGDSSDVQDSVFKQLTGPSDATDGRQRSDENTTGSAEAAQDRTSTPTKMAMLVQYDDSTDDDTLDETGPRGLKEVKHTVRVEVVSPEIGEPTSFTFRTKPSASAGELGDSLGLDMGKTQPTGAAEIAALTASPPPTDSLLNAPDRTSPVILDDELLDAAFLSPETDDRS
ncbi:hypothetical protein RvY_05006 [Ramazzottius varieornatus]|uniref:Mediator of RNA polymerase II transcription subunit 1 n=1 Tax=Ramazzottius varieornatus TaxID=947166 RepID=A0A1D1UX35_RAMVA|nr:hypothetical protein RvY_05006 [Ramazzottius varieornatus]